MDGMIHNVKNIFIDSHINRKLASKVNKPQQHQEKRELGHVCRPGCRKGVGGP